MLLLVAAAAPGVMSYLRDPAGPDLIGLFFHLGGTHPVGVLVGSVAFGAAFIAFGDQWFGDRVRALPGFLSGRGMGSGLDAELPSDRLAALTTLRARDPGFDEAAFLGRASKAFEGVLSAWGREDASLARAFVSDGVRERFRRRAAELSERGLRRRVSAVALRETEVLGYRAGERYDAVFVGFTAAVTDELVREDDGTVASGGPVELTEVWTFLRRPGARTLARPGALEGCCPSCGAPLTIVDAAQCGACKAWVNSGEHDWVLTGTTAVSDWAFPSPDREADGWPVLRAADPGLSAEGLEDRAAVVFWRWHDARRRADAAPLRAVADEAFLRGLSLGAAYERDATVSLVELTACETADDFDRVHVQVRWQADKMRRLPGGDAECVGSDQRVDYLVFHRRAEAVTDLRTGLSTARCPACGAPPAEADAACPYCGLALNDGSRTWVLVDIVPYGRWRRPGAVDAGPPSV